MPPKRYISWPFIAQVLNEDKLLLKQSQVRINVIPPKVKDLTIKAIWNSMQQDDDFLRFFPDPCIDKEPPRGYFFSILSAIRPQVFQSILDKAEQRYRKLEEDNINMFTVSSRVMEELNKVSFKYSIMKKRGDKRICIGGYRVNDSN